MLCALISMLPLSVSIRANPWLNPSSPTELRQSLLELPGLDVPACILYNCLWGSGVVNSVDKVALTKGGIQEHSYSKLNGAN
jgi:hypothetical protein